MKSKVPEILSWAKWAAKNLELFLNFNEDAYMEVLKQETKTGDALKDLVMFLSIKTLNQTKFASKP